MHFIPKSTLRIEYLARRQELLPETVATCASSITERILELIPDDCHTVAGYAAIRNEVPVWSILEKLAIRGVTVALPCLVDAGLPLQFRRWKPGQELVPGPYRTLQPSSDSPLVVPEVVLVPLLVFDRRGHRLGFGAGYYDRTLYALRQMKHLRMSIGIAYSLQETARLPDDPHDEMVDYIVTEREIIKA